MSPRAAVASMSPSEPRIVAESSGPVGVEDRIGSLERTLAGLLEELAEKRQSVIAAEPGTSPLSREPAATPNPPIALPPWEKVLRVAELFQIYCDGQPLPLFRCDNFLETLEEREPEVLFGILSLALRFSDDTFFSDDVTYLSKGYSTAAREIALDRVSKGPIEISTLQTFCLLALIDLTNGDTVRSRVHAGLAMNLANCSSLNSNPSAGTNSAETEERRRCFWSISLVGRLHGSSVEFFQGRMKQDPPFPVSVKPNALPNAQDESNPVGNGSHISHDSGIIGYVMLLTKVWSAARLYLESHGNLGSVPPWSPKSEYSKVFALLTDLGIEMHPNHRYRNVRPLDRSAHDLQTHRAYWGPWFLTRFLYHTIICILNHPLLITLQLQQFGQRVPEVFLQQTGSQLSIHTNWLMHYMKFFKSKPFKVSDPFLGHCIAILATIELQLSFSKDPETRKLKQENFAMCLEFTQSLGREWPHMLQIAKKLQHLTSSISVSYSPEHNSLDGSLSIDLSPFWDLLNYLSASTNEIGSSDDLVLGASLTSSYPQSSRNMSNLNLIPTPTVIEVAPDGPSLRRPPYNSIGLPSVTRPPMSEVQPVSELPLSSGNLTRSENLSFPEDIFLDNTSLLPAEQFFAQDHNFVKALGSDWWNIGDL
ncbi:hypothetical protein BP5796_12166 [Coleophoma crateriformis]|uniref:Xylanolytic transcriptional activator regulatory domain-containing protein n=1 Tax=Coleophoma crateriformis TaxID=565419 RepID=A0A3D8QBM1_9HELO|nr:hypothetical protein BP5796_12166 [Coleophoma crateriformis]